MILFFKIDLQSSFGESKVINPRNSKNCFRLIPLLIGSVLRIKRSSPICLITYNYFMPLNCTCK